MSPEQGAFIRDHLQLGLCCINTVLREGSVPVFNSRTVTRSRFTVERAQELAIQNVRDLIPMIEYNYNHQINVFRISSDIFPHFTDREVPSYTIDFARDDLQRAGDLAKHRGQRILAHPGQYNQVGALDPAVFESTVADLSHHADILDAMGIDDNGVLIVHGGGVYGDKSATMERWIRQFWDLPESVRRRLVIENCERGYSTVDCLYLARATGIPMVFDFHHYWCWDLLHPGTTQPPISELFPQILATWGDRRPVMHISSQAEGKRIGTHADFIDSLPVELFEGILTHRCHIDLEIEAKAKEQAIFQLRRQYPMIWTRPKLVLKLTKGL